MALFSVSSFSGRQWSERNLYFLYDTYLWHFAVFYGMFLAFFLSFMYFAGGYRIFEYFGQKPFLLAGDSVWSDVQAWSQASTGGAVVLLSDQSNCRNPANCGRKRPSACHTASNAAANWPVEKFARNQSRITQTGIKGLAVLSQHRSSWCSPLPPPIVFALQSENFLLENGKQWAAASACWANVMRPFHTPSINQSINQSIIQALWAIKILLVENFQKKRKK
jgi:hypothetical protein